MQLENTFNIRDFHVALLFAVMNKPFMQGLKEYEMHTMDAFSVRCAGQEKTKIISAELTVQFAYDQRTRHKNY